MKEIVFQISSLSKTGISELINFLELLVKKVKFSENKNNSEFKKITLKGNSIWDD